MGERYLDGEGVPKDLDKAREYLTKAAQAGSAEAGAKLKEVNAAAEDH
jgi:TPR repeat protein